MNKFFSFNYWFEKFKNLSSSILHKNQSNVETDNKLKTLLNDLNIDSYVNRNLIVPEIEEGFSISIKAITTFGFHNGVYKINSDLATSTKTIIESRAQNLYDSSKIILAYKLANLEAEVKANEEHKERIKKNLESNNEIYQHILHYREFYSNSFSLWLCLFYLIISFVLILADLPLAAMLIEKGFNFHEGQLILHQLFEKGQFWNVCRENWEVIFTAIGISLATVYIKIYYDEFIAKQYGFKTLAESKFNKLFNLDQDQQFMENVARENKRKNSWKNGILIFTVITFLILGIFRSQTMSEIEELKGMSVPNWLVSLTFTFITFLFPIISGVCLSLSLTIFQNIVNYSISKRIKIKMELQFDGLLERLFRSREQHDSLKLIVEQWNDKNERIQKFIDMLFSYYWQGYYVGITEPDWKSKELDLFERVSAGRNTYLSGKINELMI